MNGKEGDHPFTDIVAHHHEVFGKGSTISSGSWTPLVHSKARSPGTGFGFKLFETSHHSCLKRRQEGTSSRADDDRQAEQVDYAVFSRRRGVRSVLGDDGLRLRREHP
jgi:hypothetical protein